MNNLINVYEKALHLAATELYWKCGCVGGGMCTVATTGYDAITREKICVKCWFTDLIEKAYERIEEDEHKELYRLY